MDICVIRKPDSVSYQDIQQVMLVAHEAAQGDGLEFPTSSLTASEIQSRVDQTGACFVAIDGDKVVGTISATREKINKWYARGAVMAFRYVAVLPEYSGQHISYELYNAGIEYASQQGINTCIVTMSEYNSHHLHVVLKYGFRKVDFLSFAGLKNNSIRVAYQIDNKLRFSGLLCKFRYYVKRYYVFLKNKVRKTN